MRAALARTRPAPEHPVDALRREMAAARAVADANRGQREMWLAYARGIENALRTLGHPAGAPSTKT